jgi:hypothetical protein
MTVAVASRLLNAALVVDGAILDINLGGETSFPVADVLRERGIPFVLATGYDEATIPQPYLNVLHFEKPADMQEVVQVILE